MTVDDGSEGDVTNELVHDDNETENTRVSGTNNATPTTFSSETEDDIDVGRIGPTGVTIKLSRTDAALPGVLPSGARNDNDVTDIQREVENNTDHPSEQGDENDTMLDSIVSSEASHDVLELQKELEEFEIQKQLEERAYVQPERVVSILITAGGVVQYTDGTSPMSGASESIPIQQMWQ